jgi:hypothetical protein
MAPVAEGWRYPSADKATYLTSVGRLGPHLSEIEQSVVQASAGNDE